MQGLILAAGRGTRLHPLTLFRAKPAIPFLNRPLVSYALDLLGCLPLSELIVNLHHLPDTVRSAVEAVAPSVCYSPEELLLGTAGAVGRVRGRLRDDPFVVCNGKIYFEEDLQKVVDFHHDRAAMVTLVLVNESGEEGFRPVRVDRRDRVVGFGEVGCPDEDLRSYTFTGVQVMSRRVLDFIPEGPSELVDDLYMGLLREGQPVLGFVSEACWCECSTPERYLRKSLEILQHRGWDCLADSDLPSIACRNSVVGRGVEVATDCRLEQCVVWDDVRIGRASELRRSIVLSDVDLPPESRFSDVIITPSERGEAGHQIWPLKELSHL